MRESGGLRGCGCTFDANDQIVDECGYHLGARWKAVEAGAAGARHFLDRAPDKRQQYIDWLIESYGCQREERGACSSLRCMKRGGYTGPGAVNYDIATCEVRELIAILKSMPSSDGATTGSGPHNIFEDEDHQRGCQGRTYTCTCGYDDRVIARGAELERLLSASRPSEPTPMRATRSPYDCGPNPTKDYPGE